MPGLLWAAIVTSFLGWRATKVQNALKTRSDDEFLFLFSLIFLHFPHPVVSALASHTICKTLLHIVLYSLNATAKFAIDGGTGHWIYPNTCLLYTSDAADDLLCVDLGGR